MCLMIRNANAGDKEMFIDLCLQLTYYNWQGHNLSGQERLKKRLQKRRETAEYVFSRYIEQKDKLIFIAMLSGKAVGYAIVYNLENSYGYLDEMYVNDEYRGLGAGRELMEAIVAWVRESGLESLRLNVFSWNNSAREFYKGEGFTEYYITYVKKVSALEEPE